VADVEDILCRVEDAVCEGQAWRAKEILRGNIRNSGFAPRLYERYGRLLLELGEQYEAGKYLFLSGERDRAYEESISLFLRRQRGNPPNDIALRFPRGARLAKLSAYPEPLRSDLRKFGVRGRLPVPDGGPHDRDPEPSGLVQWLFQFGCFLLAAIIIVLTIIGFLTVVGLLSGE
jgi:hypothetical protein